MTSNKQKGDSAEKQMVSILIAWGYDKDAIDTAKAAVKLVKWPGRAPFFISKKNDMYGLFDITAKKKGTNLFVQVKSTASHAYTAKKEIQEFAWKYGSASDEYIIAQKVSRKGFILRYFDRIEYVNFKGKFVSQFGVTASK